MPVLSLRQRESSGRPDVQPHGVAEDLDRKAVVLICRSNGVYLHDMTFTHRIEARQVDNAVSISHSSLVIKMLLGSSI